ncbi:hypothetical protein ACLOEZ_10415 [Levilactobacillus brevis]|uniref:hypothetical protein n=1 Tax=Levilactobacillus brevis TaxID=1580 RepID=UPI003EB77AE3
MFTEIECDRCEKQLMWEEILTKGRVIRVARKRGWSIGKLNLCPDCRRPLKSNKEEVE